MDFINENNLLRNTQHGFVSKRSCLTNLLIFLNFSGKMLDSAKAVDVLYLDFQKAFDKVPHNLLIVKLQSYGFNSSIIEWIKNWLSNRVQRVIIGSNRSACRLSKVEFHRDLSWAPCCLFFM